MLKEFLWDESGTALAEYAVLLLIVTAVLIAAVNALGISIGTLFGSVATTLRNIPSG